MQVAVDAAGLLGGLRVAGGALAQRRLSALPALDVAGVAAADEEHRLDRVGGARGAPQRRRQTQAADGQGVLEALAKGPGRSRVALVELPGQSALTLAMLCC